MPGWVSYQRIGFRKMWEVGEWVRRHDSFGRPLLVWCPIATYRTKWARDRKLRRLRFQSIHRYDYRQIRVPR